MMAGALTPTEVITAWKAGSDFAKVFPCAQVGGDNYIRGLRGPLPHVPLIAAGGVNQQTPSSFILAGADAIGVNLQGSTSTAPRWVHQRVGPGAKPSQGVIWNWWRQGMMGGAKAHYDGIVAFSQMDFTEDLKKITVPVLVMHGDDDQIVPYADSAASSAKLLRNSTLKTYKGFPHGMPTTEADTINADLLKFVKGTASTAAA